MSDHAHIPRSPYAPKPAPMVFDAEEKLRSWGVEPDPSLSEPEPVAGPAVDGCSGYHSVIACAGSFRLTGQDGPMWIATCDGCAAEVAVPARKMDPEIRRAARLHDANLPAIFAGRKFEEDADNGPVLKALRQWILGYDRKLGASSLLPAPCVFGELGRGKSMLLAKVCERVIAECDLPVAFTTTRALLRDLQRFDDDVLRGRAWERATTVDVLALDDLGAEQSTDWRLDQLADLVDERYQHERPILLATNYRPEMWEQKLDHRTISRLRQMTFPLELKGIDRREQESAMALGAVAVGGGGGDA